MPTGVTVSEKGRIFVNYPYWSEDINFTVAELKNGIESPFPNLRYNSKVGKVAWNTSDQANYFISVQAVRVDSEDRLWILDTGRPIVNGKMLNATRGGPKLIAIDLTNNTVVKNITFPIGTTVSPISYLNDVRFDLRILSEGVAYISDSSDEGYNGFVVVDLASGNSWRRLHKHETVVARPEYVPVVGGFPIQELAANSTQAKFITTGVDGLTLSNDGTRLFYCPLASRRLYSVSARILANPNAANNATIDTIVDHGEKGGTSDGLESDDQNNVYISNQDQNAIYRAQYQNNTLQLSPWVRDPRLQWVDTLNVGWNHRLYFTSNQLHLQAKYWGGQDRRKTPYLLFSVGLSEYIGRVNLTCVSTGLVACSGDNSGRPQCRC
ncbi:major royal jelly protein [Phlyctochytrium arcticum]|nr:major royal jelly protein [Phlyctochytrium arcticum]